MNRRIAPTLEALLKEPVKGVPMFAAYHGRVATRELRALLAVARTARGLVARDTTGDFVRHSDVAALARACARLGRVGRAERGLAP